MLALGQHNLGQFDGLGSCFGGCWPCLWAFGPIFRAFGPIFWAFGPSTGEGQTYKQTNRHSVSIYTFDKIFTILGCFLASFMPRYGYP